MSPYGWLLGSSALWFIASGMHQVVFAWLLVGVLRVGPDWVGTAQMVQMLPALLFLLVGGVIADRMDRRRLLMGLHCCAAAAAAIMGLFVDSALLGLLLLLGYGLVFGTIQALGQPPRDSILSEVTSGDLMKAVTGLTLVQFGGIALGSRLGAIAGWVGNPAALAIQATIALIGTVAVRRLPAAPPHASQVRPSTTLALVREGLREVQQSELLRPVALLVAADGLFFMGPFQVLVPVIVRDQYRGDITDLSWAMMTLTVGTIVGSALVLLRGGIRHKGRMFLLALFGVSACLLAIATELTFGGLILALFVWGMCHSLFFNTSRTLFQEEAPDSHRARVLSVHALGLLGMAPISNIGCGIIAGRIGPHATFAAAGAVMILITGVAWFATRVRDHA